MGWIGRQLLKVIEWKDSSNDTMVYRFPMEEKTEIMMGSKLTVRESQVAVFVNKGKIADIFEPGYYKLSTDNLPVLTSIFSWKYGFNSPFKAEIYFINTKQFINQKWGTVNPIMMRDKDFGVVRIRGFGKYSYKVNNPETFLKELFGTTERYSTQHLAEYLKSVLVSGLADAIGESKIACIDLAANYLEFGEEMKSSMQQRFEKIGLELCEFIIENISLPPEVEKAMDQRTSLGVMDDKMGTYMQYQAANALRDAAQNEGGNNFAGAGIGFGAGSAFANMMAGAMNGSSGNNNGSSVSAQDKEKCQHCGALMNKGAKFCPECGKSAGKKVCYKCGAEISEKTKFCPECGQNLKEIACSKCGASVKPGSAFCGECGQKID